VEVWRGRVEEEHASWNEVEPIITRTSAGSAQQTAQDKARSPYVPYSAPFGHRGAAHFICVALALTSIAALATRLTPAQVNVTAHRPLRGAQTPLGPVRDLRRSFVTNARRRGVPESVVMRMSGHRTRAVFERYNIVEEDDLRDAVKRIEAGIAKSGGGSGQDLDKVEEG